ncbi:MAG: Hsp20/alpha crystallin family protein [Anaerolineales bacterium]|nr:Hsp20/alpha crystallin family protein [Anaerolineales bacterium]
MLQDKSNRVHILLRSGSDDDPWGAGSIHSLGWRSSKRSHAWRPPTDVLETDDAFIVIVEVAGMRGMDFSVTFDDLVLSIRGNRTDSNVRKVYHQMEIDYGDFASDIQMPHKIDAAAIEATYSDGFLRVMLPKTSPKSIEITE